MKKKLISIILSVMLTASMVLAGCGGNDTQTAGNSSGGEEVESKTEEKGKDGASGKEVVRVVVPGISEEATIDPISGIEKRDLAILRLFLKNRFRNTISI